MDPLEAQFNAYTQYFEVSDWLAIAFLVLLVSETVADFILKQRRGLWETAANMAIAVGNGLLERSAFGLVFIVGLVLVSPLAFFDIPHNWWSWVLAVMVADFTYYWMHRWEHRVRFLWAYHVVHHSSPEFNLTTAVRLSWIESLFEWVFFVPMILMGFDVVQTIIALLIVVEYQSWIHTQKIGKLGWLDRLLNTPSVHRVHHGSNECYLDKNFGGILIIWDQLFGTYEPERESVVYGITEPIKTANPLTINFHEYGQIIRDFAKSKSTSAALGTVFGPPGWKPPG